jgi:hypothetical protein
MARNRQSPFAPFNPLFCRWLCVRGEAARRGRRVAPWLHAAFSRRPFSAVGHALGPGRRGRPADAWSLRLRLGHRSASLFLGLATPAVFFSLDLAACGLRKWPSGQVGSRGSIRRIWPSLRPPGRTSAEARNARTAFRGADLLLQTSTVAVDLTDP